MKRLRKALGWIRNLEYGIRMKSPTPCALLGSLIRTPHPAPVTRINVAGT